MSFISLRKIYGSASAYKVLYTQGEKPLGQGRIGEHYLEDVMSRLVEN